MGNVFYYDSPLGNIGIAEADGKLTHLFFENETFSDHGIEKKETPVLKDAAKQLTEYFSGLRRDFDLPLAPAGTEFQRRVWKALREIPFGETRSYKAMAAAARNEKACRAVGMANNRNPIAIIIPCHRVIGANGDLVGYGGGLDKKIFLLKLENKEIKL